MKFFLSILTILLFNQTLLAQTYGDADGCATRSPSARDLKKMPWYANNEFLSRFLDKKHYSPDSLTIFYRVPLTFWVYPDKNNEPSADSLKIKEFVQEINYYNYLNNTGFEFYLANYTYLPRASKKIMGYTLEAFFQGLFRKIPGTINVHIIHSLQRKGLFSDRKYYRGQYNSGSKAIMVRANSSPTTLTHEVGHYFGLHHPHRYWRRGKRKQESVSRKRKARRLFGHALNCEVNGDALCGTPAEPSLYNAVDADCNYTGQATDNWGDTYKPLTNNIMSYPAWIKCRDSFTEDQKAVMLYTAEQKEQKFWNGAYEMFEFDAYEPNEGLAMASELRVGVKSYHSLHAIYQSARKGVVDSDVDVLKHTCTEMAEYEFRLSQTKNNQNLTVRLHKNNEQLTDVVFSEKQEELLLSAKAHEGDVLWLRISKEHPQDVPGLVRYSVQVSKR